MAADDATPTVHHQARFTDDGEVSADGEVADTSLDDFGVDVDGRDRETRLDRPEASEFGVDDRPSVEQSEDGEQVALFADVAADQRTLDGGPASEQFRFEVSDDA